MTEANDIVAPQAPKMQVANLRQIRAQDFVQTYVNNTGLALNFYDLTLIFGNITVGSDGEPVVENHAAVTMSWEHAKSLAKGIMKAVEKYEEENNTTVRKLPE
jgi:uncharacterized protein DUF3467